MYAILHNNQSVGLDQIPLLSYGEFYLEMLALLQNPACHCLNYYMFPYGENRLKAIAAVGNDETHQIYVLSYEHERNHPHPLLSLTEKVYAMHIYEREIWENWGVRFDRHPWLKPVRFAFDRADQAMQVNDYPFYKLDSEETHEVGVGPIHAGVIEPGHFRFLCHGETVYHLEIQLGWQHRGAEATFLQKDKLLQRNVLCECIAGDTAVGHALTFAHNMEALLGKPSSQRLQIERSIGLELERIAMHLFDLSNLCTGIAYQLGNAVFGAWRTPFINFTQAWCGNRFGKGLIRTAGTNYPLEEALRQRLWKLLADFEEKFDEMAEHAFQLPSLQNRFDGIGKLTKKQVSLIGAVGMAAKMAGLERDVRKSHPYDAYQLERFEPQMSGGGDVFARFLMRRIEIKQSLQLIRKWLTMNDIWAAAPEKPVQEARPALAKNSFSISLVEAWRGEICHCAVTDENGAIRHYKIKDPSLHNWMALALSLRNLEISDFPINNKSYDLSYCGFDL